MPAYVVTADDRGWFEHCRRAWDLGALGRRALQPADPGPVDRHERLRRAVHDELAVHYFPGM